MVYWFGNNHPPQTVDRSDDAPSEKTARQLILRSIVSSMISNNITIAELREAVRTQIERNTQQLNSLEPDK